MHAHACIANNTVYNNGGNIVLYQNSTIDTQKPANIEVIIVACMHMNAHMVNTTSNQFTLRIHFINSIKEG